MAITVDDTVEEIIVGDSDITITTTGDLEVSVSTLEPITAVPDNDIELVVTSDDPELRLQYDDVEIVIQSVASSVISDLYIIQEAAILNNLSTNGIPEDKIESLPVSKLTSGTLGAKASLSQLIIASKLGTVLNDDEVGLTLGDHRVELGNKQDGPALPTYHFRHTNGYDYDHPSYVSNFSISNLGDAYLRGIVDILPGSSGITNLSDRGALATRDTTTFYSDTLPADPITGDLWYYTVDGANTPYRFNGSTWDSVQDADIAIAQGAVDGKVHAYWQGTPPTGLTAIDNGDLWFDTSDGNKIYYYDDAATGEPIPKWRVGQDSEIAQSIADAATAQATADGKINTYSGTTFPVYVDVNNTGTEGVGDLFYKTDTKVLYRALVFPVSAIYTPAEWEVAGNGFDDTGLITDSANLGGTANWSTVNDDNALRPEDGADVTNVGGSNYVVRGLTSPNSTSGSVVDVSAGAGDWGFVLPDSSSATQIMTFDLPSLSTELSYVVGFWASATVNGAEIIVSIPNTPVQHIVTLSTTPTFYFLDMSSTDLDMASAVLQFIKTTGVAQATSISTIYDVMFEQAVQPSDWVPFNPTTDKADGTAAVLQLAGGLEILSGGLKLNGTSAVFNGKTSSADTTAGFWIGSDGASSYDVNIGNSTEYLKWDGSLGILDIKGNIQADSFIDSTYSLPGVFVKQLAAETNSPRTAGILTLPFDGSSSGLLNIALNYTYYNYTAQHMGWSDIAREGLFGSWNEGFLPNAQFSYYTGASYAAGALKTSTAAEGTLRNNATDFVAGTTYTMHIKVSDMYTTSSARMKIYLNRADPTHEVVIADKAYSTTVTDEVLSFDFTPTFADGMIEIVFEAGLTGVVETVLIVSDTTTIADDMSLKTLPGFNYTTSNSYYNVDYNSGTSNYELRVNVANIIADIPFVSFGRLRASVLMNSVETNGWDGQR